jgi:hypothetical protein
MRPPSLTLIYLSDTTVLPNCFTLMWQKSIFEERVLLRSHGMATNNWELHNRVDVYQGTLLLTKEQVDELVELYKSIEKMRQKWGSHIECVDDAEEMWTDIPPCLDEWAPTLGKVVGLVDPATKKPRKGRRNKEDDDGSSP